MSFTWRVPLVLLAALAVCAASAGCGPALVKIKGKVVRNGEPVKGEPDQTGFSVLVVFVPFVEGGGVPDNSYTARSLAPPPGAFEVPGVSGKGIPAGKYRIVVKFQRGNEDLLEGAFAADKSPIVREILHSEEDMVIDLDKPEG